MSDPFRIPNNANVTYTSQAEPDSVDFDVLVGALGRTGVISGCGHTITGTDLNFDVALGVVVVNGTRTTVAATRVAVVADATFPRFYLVSVGTTGVPVATAGVAQSNPAFPSLPTDHVALYAIYVSANTTAITAARVISKKVYVPRGFPFKLVVGSAIAAADPGLAALADYVCDGTADNVELQASADALAQTPATYSITGNGGGKVVWYGNFNLAAPVTVTNDNIEIAGVFGATTLHVASAAFVGGVMLDVHREANNRNALNVYVHDIRFQGGNFLNASAGAITGFRLTAANSKAERLICTKLTGDGAVHRKSPAAVTANPPLGDTADQSDWLNCHFYNNRGRGFWADGAYDNRMVGCEANENDSHGFDFGGGAWQVTGGMAWVNLGYGYYIAGAQSQMFFSNCKSEQNNGGVYVGERTAGGSGPTNFSWTGGDIVSNSWTTNNATDDVQVNGASNVVFVGVTMPARTYYPNQLSLARYSINLVKGSYVRFYQCVLSTTDQYGTASVNAASGYEAELGIHDTKNFNHTGPVAVTATASPMTIQAGYAPERIYLSGGTVTGVTKAGFTVAASTNTAFDLAPRQTVIVTYTAAPTITRDKR